MPTLPFKLDQRGRHHIPRQRHRVTNWPAYDASLRRRGSLRVWFTSEAIESWGAEPRTTPRGQPCYSALAILTALTLNAVFRLAYRQAEGLLGSLVGLLGVALPVRDHTTLSRRGRALHLDQHKDAGGSGPDLAIETVRACSWRSRSAPTASERLAAAQCGRMDLLAPQTGARPRAGRTQPQGKVGRGPDRGRC